MVEKQFILCDIENENSFRREPRIHGLRDQFSSAELFDLLKTEHKISVYQVFICLHVNRPYAHVPKWLVKNVAQSAVQK